MPLGVSSCCVLTQAGEGEKSRRNGSAAVSGIILRWGHTPTGGSDYENTTLQALYRRLLLIIIAARFAC